MGNGTLQDKLDAGFSDHVDELTEGLRELLPLLPPNDIETLVRAIRCTTLGLLVDRHVQPDDFRRQLRVLIVGAARYAESRELAAAG